MRQIRANSTKNRIRLAKHLRQHEDALASAVASNNNLREQIETQRDRFESLNEKSLTELRKEFETKNEDLARRHAAQLEDFNTHLGKAQANVIEKSAEVERLQQSVDDLRGSLKNKFKYFFKTGFHKLVFVRRH